MNCSKILMFDLGGQFVSLHVSKLDPDELAIVLGDAICCGNAMLRSTQIRHQNVAVIHRAVSYGAKSSLAFVLGLKNMFRQAT